MITRKSRNIILSSVISLCGNLAAISPSYARYVEDMGSDDPVYGLQYCVAIGLAILHYASLAKKGKAGWAIFHIGLFALAIIVFPKVMNFVLVIITLMLLFFVFKDMFKYS